MRSSPVIVGALNAAVVMALPQGVTETITPDSSSPASCDSSYSGDFQIAAVPISDDMPDASGTCGHELYLEMTLVDGVIRDVHNRTGYISESYQFQFDSPPQAGAIYTGGFSVCSNGSLALGDSAVWYQCLSGDFYNLYSKNTAEQCEPIALMVLECNDATDSTEDDVYPVCQMGDGQIQAHTTPCCSQEATETPSASTTTCEVSPTVTSPATTAPVETTLPIESTVSFSSSPEVTTEEPSTTESASTTTTAGTSPAVDSSTPSPTTGMASSRGPAHPMGALVVGIIAALFYL